MDLSGIENLLNLTELNIQDNLGITNIIPIITLKNTSGSKLKTVKIKGCTNITDNMKQSMKDLGITVVEN